MRACVRVCAEVKKKRFGERRGCGGYVRVTLFFLTCCYSTIPYRQVCTKYFYLIVSQIPETDARISQMPKCTLVLITNKV